MVHALDDLWNIRVEEGQVLNVDDEYRDDRVLGPAVSTAHSLLQG